MSALIDPLELADEVDLPTPEPLDSAPRRAALPVYELLPTVLADWVTDRAERMNAPTEFLAVAALVACAGAVGNRVVVAPDPAADPTWLEAPNLWGLLIGEPGCKKSPVMEVAMRPLTEIEGELANTYREEQDRYQTELERYRRDKSGTQPLPPVERAILTRDITPEKLGALLATNPYGLTSYQDELLGLIATWERPERGGERQLYLTLWSGLASHSVRRIGRGSQYLPVTTLSLLGGAQPGPFARYVLEAANGFNHDGLLVRFQLLVVADLPPYQRIAWPDDGVVAERYIRTVRRLAALSHINGAPEQIVRSDIRRPRLTFAPEALEHFLAWRETAAREAREPECPTLTRSLIEKQPGLVAKLAALFHLIDHETPAPHIGELAMLRAIGWAHLLRGHAEYAFWGVIRPETSAAQRLAEKIMARITTSAAFDYRRITARDIYRARWRGLTDRAGINAAIAELELRGWLIRDGAAYIPNPRIWEGVNL